MKKTLCLFAFGVMLSGGVFAQKILQGEEADKMVPGSDLVRLVDGRTAPDFIRFQAFARPSAAQAQALFGQTLNLREGEELRSERRETDVLGITHTFYKHYYHNVPVEHSGYRIHSKDEQIVSMNGTLFNSFEVPVAPAVSAQTAIHLATAHVGAEVYQWEIPSQESFIKLESGDPQATFYPQPQLVIISKNADYENTDFRLAWKMDIYANAPLSRQYVYIDAISGEVIWTENRICHADTQGSGTTGYSGTRQFITDSFNGGFRLREAGRGNGIRTFDMNNTTTYSLTDFVDADNNWINLVPAIDRYALDAHWGAEMTYDYFMNEHNRNSIDNNGFQLNSYVHYGNNYANAFWDGQRMTYGDGGGSLLINPLTTMDITGHEVTHGLTEFTANLIYSYESGALNESFSDIFGACIDFYARGTTGTNLWLIGDECTNGNTGIRNMANPAQFGDPDTYGTGLWYTGTGDNGGVHWNSGVQNFWFYVLSQGGTGTNDYGNAYNVSAIGMTDAAAVAFRNLTVYLSASSQYADARFYAILSAEDLFGACSPQVISTTNAWYAVGVGAPFNATVTAAFNSPATQYCSANAEVLFNNTSTNGSSYKWYFGDGDSSVLANPTHIYGTGGTYTVTLIVDGGTCGRDTLVMNNYITITPPPAPVSSDVLTCNSSGSFALTATGSGTINWYNNFGDITPIFTGNIYNTPVLTSSTTYYVENSISQAPVTGGPATNSFGTGGQHNNNSIQYLTFDVFQSCTLVNVRVYSGGTGNRTIYLWDANGNQLNQVTVNIPNGTSTVTLNFPLQPGSYRIGGSFMNLYRNATGAQFPYNVGSLLSLTGSSAGSAYYYYFYNWQVQGSTCNSNRLPVNVTFAAPPTVVANASNNPVCQGDQVILTGSGAQNYSWDNGVTDGVPFVPGSSGTYTVTGTDINGCSSTSSISLTVSPLPNVTANASANPVCAGSTVVLTGGGAQNYSWNNGVTNGVGFQPQTTTTYTVTGTDVNNCSNTDAITITVNPLPTIDFSLSTDTVCTDNGPVTLSAGPSGGTFSGPGVSGNAFDPLLGPGQYAITYTFTDANGCTGSVTNNIVVKACLGLDNAFADQWNIYPNPANGIFFVETVNATGYSLNIYNALGQIVYNSLIQSPVQQVMMDVRPGIYFAEITNGIFTQRKPIIIQ